MLINVNVSAAPAAIWNPQDQTRKWVTQGSATSGIDIPPSSFLPEWVDPDLVREGQAFVKRHIFAVLFAHLISLIFLLCYAPIRIVLLATGQSHSAHRSKLRYFSTLLHVKKWYEGNLLDPTSDSFILQDIIKVTRIHAGVVERLNKSKSKYQHQPTNYDILHMHDDCNTNANSIVIDVIRKDCNHYRDQNNNDIVDIEIDTHCPHPIISQLDMAVTQFCFMGFIPLFPTEFGAPSSDERGLLGFLHLWALIGHYLGIRPQFNLALPENATRRNLVWTQLLVPHFSACAPDSFRLWTWLVEGLSSFIPFLSLKSLLIFIQHRLLKVEKDATSLALWGQLNFRDRICFKLMDTCFGVWLKFSVGRIVFNTLVKLTIYLFQLTISLKLNLDI